MNNDFNTITVEDIGMSLRGMADRARTTIGLRGGDKEIKPDYARALYLSEHSPIRTRIFLVRIEGIPSWIATHFSRHHVGVEKFISTQRDDRNKQITDRDEAPQGNKVDLELVLNAQAFISISRKRLCTCSHPRTLRVWKAVIKELEKIDPQLAQVCVPDCIYRGHCYEYKTCKYHLSQGFQKKLESYRENINEGRFLD